MNDRSVDLSLYADIEMLKQVETPCYIFDPAKVVGTYLALRETLGTPLMLSFKANANVDLFVRCAHAFTDGIELASQGELTLISGRTAAPKFVNTPAMDKGLMQAATAARATLVLDNLLQVDTAIALARSGAALQPVVLRVNAISILGESGARVQADHFGMDRDMLRTAVQNLSAAGIAVRGLHVFAGSYTFDVCAIPLAEAALRLFAQLNEYLAEPMSFLNLGGGFADDWDSNNPKFAEYREVLAKVPEGVTVVHEGGRSVFARGGVFVTKILAVKPLNGRYIVVCDGGLAHCFMLAQTEKVMKRLRQPRIIPLAEGEQQTLDMPAAFVGNSCNRSDVIGELKEGVLPRVGDVAVFDGCGSYHSYTPKNFLELKAPRHYIVS